MPNEQRFKKNKFDFRKGGFATWHEGLTNDMLEDLIEISNLLDETERCTLALKT
jgi:hypothetical protein